MALFGLATACASTYQLALKLARVTNLFAEGYEQAQATADSMKVCLSFVWYETTASFLRRSTVTPRIIPQWLTQPLFAARPAGCPPRPPPGQKANRLNPLPGTGVTAAIAAAS